MTEDTETTKLTNALAVLVDVLAEVIADRVVREIRRQDLSQRSERRTADAPRARSRRRHAGQSLPLTPREGRRRSRSSQPDDSVAA